MKKRRMLTAPIDMSMNDPLLMGPHGDPARPSVKTKHYVGQTLARKTLQLGILSGLCENAKDFQKKKKIKFSHLGQI